MASVAADSLLILGGLGLFLLGMLVLTEGLRQLAGEAMRRLLARFTRTPARGILAGALTTALVQSSSATTVTAVGFVGAGLLSFPQGLGIVLGANIGTTATGWIVAIVGFKLKLGVIVLPLIFLGVLMRLFSATRLRHLGWALAGFGLLFVGIDAMQQGMAPFEGAVTPADFPDDTLIGRLQLVLLGILVTIVTQSSSAGVAMALVALGSGTISFAQAAALVIGMDVGTTATAALATLGGSTATRQTGYAHVVYNLLTGLLAFILLGPVAATVGPRLVNGAAGDAQLALVAFHTGFNALGVIAVLPFTQAFARLIVHLVPERGPPPLRRLDERLLRDPAAAVDAVVATIRDIATLLATELADRLGPGTDARIDRTRLRSIEEALEATRNFVDQVRTDPADLTAHWRHRDSVHALDHLLRLSRRCGQETRIAVLRTEPRLSRLARLLRGAAQWLRDAENIAWQEERLDRLRNLLSEQRRRHRDRIVGAAAERRIGAHAALQRLDGLRWLHRVAYHLWRIVHHLRRAEEPGPDQPPEAVPALEEDED